MQRFWTELRWLTAASWHGTRPELTSQSAHDGLGNHTRALVAEPTNRTPGPGVLA